MIAHSQAVRRPWAGAVRISSYGYFLVATIGLSCLDLLATLNRQWYPWDEGTLGQMAERVLQGQLPHRDFVDTYTGGLTFFDAGVFWLFGSDLLWLRVAMLPFFIGFVVAVFYVASRVMPPAFGALLTVTIVVWSVPNYPAAMPSWFNLFLATMGVAAVVRWLESEQRRWLWIAGVAGGLSVVVKIVGVYYLVGVALFLIVRHRLNGGPRRMTVGTVVVYVVTLCCFAAVLDILGSRHGAAELIAFLIPVAAVLFALAFVSVGTVDLKTALRDVGPFLLGAALPVAAFLVPYVVTGSTASLLDDLTHASRLRLQFAAMPPLGAEWLVAAVPGVLVALSPRIGKGMSLVLAALYCGAALIPTFAGAEVLFLNPLRESVPVLCLIWAFALVRRRRASGRDAELTALLVIIAAFIALTQFPFSSYIYFLYVLPLVVLAVAAFLVDLGAAKSPLIPIVLSAYLVAGVLHLTPGVVGLADAATGSYPGLARLDVQRGRIYVPARDARTYRKISSLLAGHAQGRFTVAGPDAPEIYYLADLRNPTPMIYDFLTPERDRDRYVLDAIARRHITAIVVNRTPEFSPPFDGQLLARLERMYPAHVVVGRFDVRWRS